MGIMKVSSLSNPVSTAMQVQAIAMQAQWKRKQAQCRRKQAQCNRNATPFKRACLTRAHLNCPQVCTSISELPCASHPGI